MQRLGFKGICTSSESGSYSSDGGGGGRESKCCGEKLTNVFPAFQIYVNMAEYHVFSSTSGPGEWVSPTPASGKDSASDHPNGGTDILLYPTHTHPPKMLMTFLETPQNILLSCLAYWWRDIVQSLSAKQYQPATKAAQCTYGIR